MATRAVGNVTTIIVPEDVQTIWVEHPNPSGFAWLSLTEGSMRDTRDPKGELCVATVIAIEPIEVDGEKYKKVKVECAGVSADLKFRPNFRLTFVRTQEG